MTAIATMQEFEALAPETIITIRRAGAGAERWQRSNDGAWANLTNSGGRSIEGRYFRGAVEAGTVVVSGSTEDVEEEEDPKRWQIGDWWVHNNDNSYRYFVYSEDQSGNMHNVWQVGTDGSLSRGVITSGHVDTGQYIRILDSDWAALPNSNRQDWFKNWIKTIQDMAAPLMPPEMVDSLRNHAIDNSDEDLMTILQNNGVDVSVETPVTITGTTALSKESLSTTLAGVTVDEAVTVGWTRTFDVKVKRGCLCNKVWREAVVDPNLIITRVPANRASMSVSLICPVHDVTATSE